MSQQPNLPTPYSLGKLIDWKLDNFDSLLIKMLSLLAREIN